MTSKRAACHENVGLEWVWKAELLHERDDKVLYERDSLGLLQDLNSHACYGSREIGALEAIEYGSSLVEVSLLFNLEFEKLDLLWNVVLVVVELFHYRCCLVISTTVNQVSRGFR